MLRQPTIQIISHTNITFFCNFAFKNIDEIHSPALPASLSRSSASARRAVELSDKTSIL